MILTWHPYSRLLLIRFLHVIHQLIKMVQTYVRKPGSRSYLTEYTPQTLEIAIQAVRSGKSVLSMSKRHGIPYGTLYKKSKYSYDPEAARKPGGQQCLSKQEEAKIMDAVNKLTEWKIPLNSTDVRFLVKSFLDRQGRVTALKNNMPGLDWIAGFKKRHNLTMRLAQNIKPGRAEISPDAVKQYFTRLEKTLEGVEPHNLYNYDETNVTDDPGSKTCIVPRGLRRVERKMPHSKQATSIMFCGNAAGEYLPPMVVYKAQNLYTEWTKHGAAGVIYSVSPSGWFDSLLFQQWFFNLFLPHVRGKPGKKVLIGDNLASHFSLPVLKACEEENISFTSLIPHSTHLLQPLDVCVFGPAKRVWRKVMDTWRKETRTKASIPKSCFPALLKRLFDQMPGEHLISGFKACGILPLDPAQVLKRLPGSEDSASALNDSVTSLLQEHLLPKAREGRQKRGPRVQPGVAVTSGDISQPSSSGTQSKKQTKKPTGAGAQKKNARKRSFVESSDSESSDDDTGDDSCQICEKFNSPGQREGDTTEWQGCEGCGKWYHSVCLQDEMNDTSAAVEDFCECGGVL